MLPLVKKSAERIMALYGVEITYPNFNSIVVCCIIKREQLFLIYNKEIKL